MRSPRVALVAGLALVLAAIGLTLSRSPVSVAGTNRSAGRVEELIGSTLKSSEYCQSGETLPRGTSAIRVWMDAAAGPHVKVVVLARGRPVTSGQRGSNWIGGSVTVPVKPLPDTVGDATVCVSFPLRYEEIIFQGNPSSPATAAHDGSHRLKGRIWMEYLRPGTRTWASMLAEVARRVSFGRALTGTWVVLLLLALVCAIAGLASSLVLRELR
jgi:hypothetical protein